MGLYESLIHIYLIGLAIAWCVWGWTVAIRYGREYSILAFEEELSFVFFWPIFLAILALVCASAPLVIGYWEWSDKRRKEAEGQSPCAN